MLQASVSSTSSGGNRDADRRSARADLLDDIAARALMQVADQFCARRVDPDGSALDRLYSAAIGADPRACAEVALALIADGLAAERVCDVHIPAAARRLGKDWINDDLSFSAVTIGTARLQSLLSELDLRLDRGTGLVGNGGSILLVIAPGADHTLGALVLASQLRRKGFSVRVSLGEDLDAMAGTAAGARFDAVFLSATIAESLSFLIAAAAAIRAATSTPPRMILGGALIAQRDATCRDLQSDPAFEGIDHVTCDLNEAIRLCGLTSDP